MYWRNLLFRDAGRRGPHGLGRGRNLPLDKNTAVPYNNNKGRDFAIVSPPDFSLFHSYAETAARQGGGFCTSRMSAAAQSPRLPPGSPLLYTPCRLLANRAANFWLSDKPLDKHAALPYNNNERADTRQRFSPVSLGFKNRNRHLPGWRFLRFLIMIVTV